MNLEIKRIHHLHQWHQYANNRDRVIKPMNHGNACETHLFHGTGSLNPSTIINCPSGRGLDSRKSKGGGFYGDGIYLAEKAGYAMHYAFYERSASGRDTYVLLVVRTALGEPREMGVVVTPDSRKMRTPGMQACGMPYGCVTGGPHRPFLSGSAKAPGESDKGEKRLDESRIFAIYDPNQCYIEYVLKFELEQTQSMVPTNPSLKCPFVRGDVVYYSSYSRSYPNGDQAIFGSKAVVKSGGSLALPDSVRIQFKENRLPVRLHTAYISKTRPTVSVTIAGDQCKIGDVVYYTGPCRRFNLNGTSGEVRYGDECTIAGLALRGTTHLGREQHVCDATTATSSKYVPWDKDVAAVQFPWNASPVVVPCNSLDRKAPSQILKGNFRVGDRVYYTGSFDEWISKLIDYGASGIVVGPARHESYLMIKFGWQVECMELPITDLSCQMPQPLLHGVLRVGQGIVYNGPSVSYRTRTISTDATSIEEAYEKYMVLLDHTSGDNTLLPFTFNYQTDVQLIVTKGSRGIVLAPDVVDPRKRGVKRARLFPEMTGMEVTTTYSAASPSNKQPANRMETRKTVADKATAAAANQTISLTPHSIPGPSVLLLFFHSGYLSCVFVSITAVVLDQ